MPAVTVHNCEQVACLFYLQFECGNAMFQMSQFCGTRNVCRIVHVSPPIALMIGEPSAAIVQPRALRSAALVLICSGVIPSAVRHR